MGKLLKEKDYVELEQLCLQQADSTLSAVQRVALKAMARDYAKKAADLKSSAIPKQP